MATPLTKFKLLLGSGFYSGFLPQAPGTWGSLVALVPIYLLSRFFPLFGLPLFLLLSILASLWVTEACVDEWGKDPSKLVLDEWAGQAVVFLGLPFYNIIGPDLLLLITGFIFFRFFDIKKPLGVNELQQFPGGWGILLDDLLAGVYAMFCLYGSVFGYALLSALI